MAVKWQSYVKVWRFSDDPTPYYLQWVVLCWHKPIYIGLPLLIIGFFPIMCLDMLVGIGWLITNWGRRQK